MQTEAIFENIADRIQKEISSAQKSIFIAIAWFTNRNLFEALLERARNGCTVSLIVSNDEINLNSSIDVDQLEIGNSKVFKIGNGDTELMHNKFCVIDSSHVITGSYNWSYKAERNLENIILTKNDAILAKQFIAEFRNICQKYSLAEPIEEVIFPLDQIVRRLEILKNYILLEDVEEVQKEANKLSVFDFNTDLSSIIQDIEQEAFTSAINRIQAFLSSNQQLASWTDPEIAALNLEIKTLENQLSGFANEKIELEKVLSEFQYRHTQELGEIILEILKLRKLKFRADKEKYEEAEKDEEQYRAQVDNQQEILSLTDEQKEELKTKFRKASILCHPDKVSDEFQEAAQEIFIELKNAYDVNDLEKVSQVLQDLETGNFFRSRSETITEKDLLKAAISNLRRQIKQLEAEIIEIRESETFQTIDSIDNWDDYFNSMKERLIKQLKELRLEASE